MTRTYSKLTADQGRLIAAVIKAKAQSGKLIVTKHNFDYTDRGNTSTGIMMTIRNPKWVAKEVAVDDAGKTSVAYHLMDDASRVVVIEDRFKKGQFIVKTTIPMDSPAKWIPRGVAV